MNGPIPSPTHWARVQLAAGHSSAGLWDLSSQVPEARVTIGSGPEAGWNVSASGVAPVHFELYWDGTSLWVSPPFAGQLLVDGERVQAWRQLAGRARLEFGQAAMLVESSLAIAGIAPAARVGAITQPPEDDATLMAPMMATGELDLADLGPLSNESTMIFDPEAGVDELSGEATRMLDGAADVPLVGRPGVGGVPASRPIAPTVTPFGDVPASAGGFKTQILDTGSFGDATMPPVEDRQPLMASQIPTDVLPRTPSAPPSGPTVGPTGKFALPPIASAEPAPKGKLQLPPTRTLVLLGITIVVAAGGLGLIAWRKSQRAEAASAAVEESRAQQEAQAAAAAAEIRARIERARELRQEQEARLAVRVQARVDTALERAREAARAASPRAATEEEIVAAVEQAEHDALEKLAVDALATNDFALALVSFQRLAREHPDGPYATMIPVLRVKLGCGTGVGSEARPPCLP
ncbi:MAG: hypothetical protein KF901_24045 [Myxococcales bacterium]|nr:hypothetical protein [Myxococcales bacterium]